MTHEILGIVEARKRLGSLVARAVHGHRPTVITRSGEERAVLISEEEYRELLQLRHDREARQAVQRIAAHERGDVATVAYEDGAALYADLGLSAAGEHP